MLEEFLWAEKNGAHGVCSPIDSEITCKREREGKQEEGEREGGY